ncbi:GNAT family N-acetyltransferase [Tissierella sp.]|uniref:GNAT family N-acetyltransferase n=1 Tax=Tissierella sp. TaxID=41274 RepID=UPI0030423E13
MTKVIGACGCICSECRMFEKECMGCYSIEGKACWLHEVGLDIYDFYECSVIDRKLRHCGECEEIPCERFWKNKNPKWTEEQHREIVESRVALLKELASSKDYSIKLIDNEELKSNITDFVLRHLPDWFGIEEAIMEYVDKVKETVFYVAFDDDRPIGLLSLKFNNKCTSEIYVMGILKEYHNKGIGKKLVERAVSYSLENGYKFLMVKTLGETHPDKNYKKTREFYGKVGFYPLEEIKEIWGEQNPCLLMVRSL